MRQVMNITTCDEDLLRFDSRQDLDAFYRSFDLDGLEVLEAGPARPGWIDDKNTIGVHLCYYAAWMDFWTGNRERLLAEFGEEENWLQFYGGHDRTALIEAYRNNLAFAAGLEPEYLVFHVSDCTMAESMCRRYYYKEEQVADAAIQLLNSLRISGQPWLLLENLWYPGLTMLRPEIWQRLRDGLQYEKVGVMLDVGHLLHTNMALRTADEAVDYIHSILDQYEDLSFIRGIHLHQSLTGAYAARLQETWQPVSGTYTQQLWEVMGHIFQIDTHKPFLSPRIREIIDRIQPDYLVWEQISSSRAAHSDQLAQQQAVLKEAGIL